MGEAAPLSAARTDSSVASLIAGVEAEAEAEEPVSEPRRGVPAPLEGKSRVLPSKASGTNQKRSLFCRLLGISRGRSDIPGTMSSGLRVAMAADQLRSGPYRGWRRSEGAGCRKE